MNDGRWTRAAEAETARDIEKITRLSAKGADQTKALAKATGNAPDADVGMLAAGAPEWAPGTAYERFDLFRYNGAMGYVKQAHTSLEVWLPFTTGTESLYGARPAPDKYGIYPYVYNMAASVGMKVRDPDDGKVYVCIQDIPDMLYKPHIIPAHFEVVDDE